MFKAVKKFLRILGPGIITGAADDDPSGIATYADRCAIWLWPTLDRAVGTPTYDIIAFE